MHHKARRLARPTNVYVSRKCMLGYSRVPWCDINITTSSEHGNDCDNVKYFFSTLWFTYEQYVFGGLKAVVNCTKANWLLSRVIRECAEL